MNLTIYQIDAFSHRVFGGNPAAVIPLNEWLPDPVLQAIALENNLSETAYFIKRDGAFDIRWFTPVTEVNLCGHATLATAHVLWQELGHDRDEILFHSRSGPLGVHLEADGFYTLDFPTDNIVKAELPAVAATALNTSALECWKGREDYLLLLDSQRSVLDLQPDFKMLAQFKTRGFIATAPGDDVDFVSRCFFPYFGIDEDPVTGSAHTTLAPFWANKLGKETLTARQVSHRGGFLKIHLKGERTLISGQAVTYLKGEISV